MGERRRLVAGWGLVFAAALLAGVAAVLADVAVPATWASGLAAAVTAVAGVVTVRGTGALGEAGRRRRGLPELIRVDRAGRAPLIGDLDDPVSLGVHPAASAVGEGVVTRTPPFIARDVMPQVLDVLAGSRFLLLVGDSTAGKSRAAFEAVRRSFPGYRMVEPAGRRAALAAADFAASASRCVLWLDDLERFLGTGGLTGQAVSRVLDAPGRCVIAATMRSEEYARFSGSGPADLPGLGREAMRSGMDVLRLATKVDLPRHWSPGELRRAGSHDDQRIVDALRHADRFGLAEYMAAGPRLLADWRAGWAPGTHPRGAALVHAAVDARRVGVHRPLPRVLLSCMHEPYLQARGGLLLRPEPLAAAISWATAPLHATSSLLLPAAGHRYLAFDYLIDAADKVPVPAGALGALISFATGDEAVDIGYAAWSWCQFGEAESAFRAAYAKGNWRAAGVLSDYLDDTDGPDRALRHAREILAETMQAHGPDSERTLWARFSVAFETGRAGQHKTAVRLLEQVHADTVRVLGGKHELARHIMSRIPQWLDDPEAAAQMNAELIARYAPEMDESDPFMIGLRHQEATWTGRAGDPARAASLARQLADRITQDGVQGRGLRSARFLAARWAAKAGRPEEAIPLWEEYVADMLTAEGRFTTQSLHARYELAECHGAAGDTAHALEIMEDVMADAAQLQTTRDLDLLKLARGLAHWTGKAGNPGKAVALLRQLAGTTADWRGNQDPYTLGLRWRLADWIGETGDRNEAVRQLQTTLADATKALGADHDVTQATRERLQNWQSPNPHAT